jgi:hypothetical protein
MDSRELLWEEVTFFIVPGQATDEAIIAALGIEATKLGTRPRRFALAETLQMGDYDGGSEEELAIFSHGGFTWVAPPAMVFARTGMLTWPTALSTAFGTCHVFTTTIGAPGIHEFRDGEHTGEVSDFRLRPESGVLGIANKITDITTILDALERHVGSQLRDVFGSGEAAFWKRART